jgi:hypothetical protein
MNTNELKLCIAIHKAELGGGDRPTGQQRIDAARRVMECYLTTFETTYFPYHMDDIERLSLSMRKSNDTKWKVRIAIAHGWKCFWDGRDCGECSQEIELGHIVSRSDGGNISIANCWIECRDHNNDRRDRTIEDYLKSRCAVSTQEFTEV